MNDIKFNNKKAWPSFKPLIEFKDTTKYKNLKDAKLHLKLCSQEPQKVFYEVDGIEVSLYYKHGILAHVINKSNEDIYSNAINFKGVPKTVTSSAPDLIIKGIITISKKNFEKIKNNYSSIRYATAGISRRIDSIDSDLIEFYSDSIYLNNELNNKLIKLSIDATEKFLEENGFISQLNLWIINEKSKEERLSDIYSDTESLNNFKYEVVSLYIKHDSYEFRVIKQQETAETKITSYEWSLTLTNKLVPVAVFEPVSIDNTTITRASLTSARNFILLDAPVNSTIEVIKADGVLPYIKNVKEKSGELEIPKTCPLCGQSLEWKGAHLVCINIDCKNRLLSNCDRVVSHLKIPRLTISLIENLIEQNYIKHPKDIFTLAPEELTSVKFGNRFISIKQAKTLINNINEKRKSLSESDFVFLLNLPKISKLIINKLQNKANEENISLLDLIEQCNVSILSKVLMESKIKTIINFMQSNQDIYNKFKTIVFSNRD